jgi:hypothetical protein
MGQPEVAFSVAIFPKINRFIKRWRFGQMWVFVLCQEHSTEPEVAFCFMPGAAPRPELPDGIFSDQKS